MEKECQQTGITSVEIPIFRGKGDIMNCGMYRCVRLTEHSMKIVERAL